MFRKFAALFMIFGLFDLSFAHNSIEIVNKFKKINNNSEWILSKSTKLKGNTYHPQGMVAIGDYYYISAVDVINRKAEKGKGYLFKFDKKGNLIEKLELDQGKIYHPGGIDTDGEFIWVPVAEYKPGGNSIIYKIDPDKMDILSLFSFDDHIGAVAYNSFAHELYGVSWGSRELYTWDLAGNLKGQKENTEFYIDYQDCHFFKGDYMLCGGLNNYEANRVKFALGGLELLSTKDMSHLYQVPVKEWVRTDLVMTNNPYWVEEKQDGKGLVFYFALEDNTTTIYEYLVNV